MERGDKVWERVNYTLVVETQKGLELPVDFITDKPIFVVAIAKAAASIQFTAVETQKGLALHVDFFTDKQVFLRAILEPQAFTVGHV